MTITTSSTALATVLARRAAWTGAFGPFQAKGRGEAALVIGAGLPAPEFSIETPCGCSRPCVGDRTVVEGVAYRVVDDVVLDNDAHGGASAWTTYAPVHGPRAPRIWCPACNGAGGSHDAAGGFALGGSCPECGWEPACPAAPAEVVPAEVVPAENQAALARFLAGEPARVCAPCIEHWNRREVTPELACAVLADLVVAADRLRSGPRDPKGWTANAYQGSALGGGASRAGRLLPEVREADLLDPTGTRQVRLFSKIDLVEVEGGALELRPYFGIWWAAAPNATHDLCGWCGSIDSRNGYECDQCGGS